MGGKRKKKEKVVVFSHSSFHKYKGEKGGGMDGK